MSNYTKSTNFATKDNLTPGDPLKIVRGTEIDTEFNNIATAIATKTDNASAAITGGSITGITDLAIADGGTGASTANAALNNLLPSQASASGKYLKSNGTDSSWDALDISTADITGTLPVANGGTGVSSSTGTGSVVLSNSPTLVTPALGTPASGTLTNATGLPISTGVSGLGTGVATFLGTPSSANLASAVSDETGSGALVFANSPTLVTPALGTPSSATLTNATGLPISTGVSGLGTGVATFLATPSSANLRSALTDETGSGSAVFATSPALVTPDLGTPSAATLTNATGLPISTGVSGLGTGVATALAVNVGSAGAPVVNGGALGTPSSGTVTNLTGTASININGTVGATTPTTGAFTTVAASSDVTLSGGTANGVTYLNGSKVLTSGSALSFNGTNALTVTANSAELYLAGGSSAAQGGFLSISRGGTAKILLGTASNVLGGGSNTSDDLTLFATAESRFYASSAEGMRLTSTGLGIGTSSPSDKLTVASNSCIDNLGANYKTFSGTNYYYGQLLLKDPSNRTVVVRSPGAVNEAEIGTSTGHPLNIITNDTVRATFDVSGNLGLGVTPSAWASGWKAMQVGPNSAAGFIAGVGNDTYFGDSAYYNSGWKYAYSGVSVSLYRQTAGIHSWSTAASGTAGDAISFTQAMTLDASGNLFLGATSDSVIGGNRLLVQSASSASNYRVASFYNTAATSTTAFNNRLLQLSSNGSGADVTLHFTDQIANNAYIGMGSGALYFATGGTTERARITSGGYFKASFDGTYNSATGQFHEFVGNVANGYTVRTRCANASPANHYIGEFVFSAASPNNTGALFIECRDSTAARFELRSNGGLANYSANDVNLSDRREKTNFAPAKSYLDTICAIPVQTFNYIDQNLEEDAGLTLGVVAQDVQAVAPELVMESNWAAKGEEPKMRLSIYQTDLQYALMKCIQEQQAIIESLKARLDAANL